MTTSSFAQQMDRILTFRGEFSDKPLALIRNVARALEPVEELAQGASPEDAAALFELIELQGTFNAEFINLLRGSAQDIRQYIFTLASSERKPKDRIRVLSRFDRQLRRIRTDLSDQGYELTQRMVNEILAMKDLGEANLEVRTQGAAATRARRLGVHRIHGNTEDQIKRYFRGFDWHMIADLARKTPPDKPRQLPSLNGIRAQLRTIDLDLSDGRYRYLPYLFGPGCNLPEYRISIAQSLHPLSLARIFVHDPNTLEVIVDAELSRYGHILFGGCSFLTVHGAFDNVGASRVYKYMCDVITYAIWMMLEQGTLAERTYISDEASGKAEPIEIMESQAAAVEPISTPAEVELEPEPEAVTPSNSPATLDTVADAPAVRTSKSHWGYRRILAALVHFGVTATRDGKHLKLRLGSETAPFLNRHRHEDPNFNKYVTRKVLEKLGIDADEFEARLRG